MHAELYGYRVREGTWKWEYTLDFEVDRMWRPGLVQDGTVVIRFKPLWSVGQASWLADWLGTKLKQGFKRDDLRRELIAGCKRLGIGRNRQSGIGWVRWDRAGQSKQVQLDEGYQANPQGQLNIEQASTSSRAPLNNRVLDQMIRILAGRSLLSGELMGLMESSGLGDQREEWSRYVQAGVCLGRIEVAPGMEVRRHAGLRVFGEGGLEYVCRRCGSGGSDLEWVPCRDCGGPCPYCTKCLTMGRIRSCTLLVRGVAGSVDGTDCELGEAERGLSSWGLSPAQEAASAEGLWFLRDTSIGGKGTVMAEGRGSGWLSGWWAGVSKVEKIVRPPRFLIWAVTGAGKTEMIFPMLEYELKRGRKVLVTTPRKDVVLELKPRLAKAFEGYSVVALYGGSEDRWDAGDITLATTHQLMRFHRAFDLVIIDEIDAFPYYNNPMLIYAAEQVCKKEGRYVLLSATPPIGLQKEAHSGKLRHVRVPVRYHRHPLPVPIRVAIAGVEQMIRRGRLPRELRSRMDASVGRGAQVFVFVPKIVLVGPMVELLKKAYPKLSIEGTSSKDEERGVKVVDFREKRVDMLVTTTILERGVTVPKTDVYILGADSALFDEASLVQMAGRAGRSKDDPYGRVTFASKDWTSSQASAIKQIRVMNRIARRKSYLVEQEGEKS